MNNSPIIPTGLAIFSMLFGAGNLMYPLLVGMTSGDKTLFGMMGFLLTAVCLPVAGLIGMILFDGDYKTFFTRIGEIPGKILLFCSIMIIGPIVAIPRIVTLSHTMIAPFFPIAFLQTITPYSSFCFSLLFLGITFLATYRESKIIDVLGKYISPTLLITLVIIIVKGIATAEYTTTSFLSTQQEFVTNFMRGYETLDLLGTIFFASIIISLLRSIVGKTYSNKQLAHIGFKSGLLGTILLGLVYTGMSILGMYHGHGMQHFNPGELFREISFVVLGSYGAAIIATAVLMACLSTSIALSAVVAEYVQKDILNKKIDYVSALVITLLSCIPLSVFGLKKILELTGGPILYIGYPTIIALTICNILYKTVGFKPVKVPVLATFAVALICYIM